MALGVAVDRLADQGRGEAGEVGTAGGSRREDLRPKDMRELWSG